MANRTQRRGVKYKSSSARDVTPQTVASSGLADTDDSGSFFNFVGGTSASDGANIITGDQTGLVDYGAIRVGINGVPKYIALYSFA